jgi:ribonuclease PH
VDGTPVLDLDYKEDSTAEVDMNVIMTGAGKFIEVQGTAEGAPFDQIALNAMLDLAKSGIRQLTKLQH